MQEKSIQIGDRMVKVYTFTPEQGCLPFSFEEEAACIHAENGGKNYQIFCGDELLYDR